MKNIFRKRRGFTLIELLVVIAIIGIISGLIIVTMSGATSSANEAKRKSNLSGLAKSLMAIKTLTGSYPIQTSVCNVGDTCTALNSALSPDYYSLSSNIPTDGSGSYYQYLSYDGTSYSLSSPHSSCGDNVTFMYNGQLLTYGTVTSPAGKCFLDRNLGASRVANAYNDAESYGDIFQWGRATDGHQTRTSPLSSVLATSATNPGSSFITNSVSPYDWLATQRTDLWQGVSGINNPCPSGWRLPTNTEWQAEITAGSWTTRDSAYASTLKLPSAGYRNYSSGSLTNVGSNGYYWAASVTGSGSNNLLFHSSSATMSNSARAYGFSVRCLKN
ncbi:MAG: FISUMP domain-containing protein [Candidatus Pacebacteria bacterium]|nr:FISUMP domain-containing protein [Candidatus Paceibacterota bacterium]